MNIYASILNDHLRVFINDTLHLSLRVRGLVAIQGYAWPLDGRWDLEITYETGAVVKARYHNAELWKKILDEIARCELV